MPLALTALGWSPRLTAALNDLGAPDLLPARVCAVDRGSVRVLGLPPDPWEPRKLVLRLDPALAVGDWIACRRLGLDDVAEQLLPRHSMFARKAPGRASAPQLVAANVDVVLVVTALGEDFSARRVQRYVSAALAGGAQAVVIVSKADRAHDPVAVRAELEEAVPGVPVVLTSAVVSGGLDALRAVLPPHATVAFAGSSGVGKSTLINRLLGDDVQPTLPVRDSDDTGRHATTRRQLLPGPDGLLLIDTPGMREFGLVDAEAGVAATFADVEALASGCRFRDCGHRGDPGCALELAVESGELPAVRLESWLALRDEVAMADARFAQRQAQERKASEKDLSREIRRWKKGERDRGGKGA
jgi:ribosome biogenesis GTPase